MSVSDVVGGLGASGWQQVALLIFFAAFVAIVVRAWLLPRADVETFSRLPLHDCDSAAGPAANPDDKRSGS